MPHRLVEKPRVVGAKQTLKALQNGQVELVYLARDADQRVVTPVFEECNKLGIEIIEVQSMAELGRACSIEVGAAVAGIKKTVSI